MFHFTVQTFTEIDNKAVDFSISLNNDALKPAFYCLMKQKADQKMKKYFEQIG